MFAIARALIVAKVHKRLNEPAVVQAFEAWHATQGDVGSLVDFWEEVDNAIGRVRNPEGLKFEAILTRSDSWPIPRAARRFKTCPLYCKLIRVLLALDSYHNHQDFGLPAVAACRGVGLDGQVQSHRVKIWRMLAALVQTGLLVKVKTGTPPSPGLPAAKRLPTIWRVVNGD